MKQRIKVQDLRQLTYEQQNKLKSLWLPRIGNTVNYIYDEGVMFINGYAGNYNIVLIRGNERIRVAKGDCLPLLNIGQMIEILEESRVNWENELFCDDCDEVTYKYYNGELADALWNIIKKIL